MTLMVALAGHPAADAQTAAPAHARASAERVIDLVQPGTALAEARRRLEQDGMFCTWGGTHMADLVGLRFLLCTSSCTASLADGWWVYLSAIAGEGVQHIETGDASGSVIKPYLPDDCPPDSKPAEAR
jgi:hypothetical protein